MFNAIDLQHWRTEGFGEVGRIPCSQTRRASDAVGHEYERPIVARTSSVIKRFRRKNWRTFDQHDLGVVAAHLSMDAFGPCESTVEQRQPLDSPATNLDVAFAWNNPVQRE